MVSYGFNPCSPHDSSVDSLHDPARSPVPAAQSLAARLIDVHNIHANLSFILRNA